MPFPYRLSGVLLCYIAAQGTLRKPFAMSFFIRFFDTADLPYRFTDVACHMHLTDVQTG